MHMSVEAWHLSCFFLSSRSRHTRCYRDWEFRRVLFRSSRQSDRFDASASNNSYTKPTNIDRKSTRLNSSHGSISYAVFCLKTKKQDQASHHICPEDQCPIPRPNH